MRIKQSLELQQLRELEKFSVIEIKKGRTRRASLQVQLKGGWEASFPILDSGGRVGVGCLGWGRVFEEAG